MMSTVNVLQAHAEKHRESSVPSNVSRKHHLEPGEDGTVASSGSREKKSNRDQTARRHHESDKRIGHREASSERSENNPHYPATDDHGRQILAQLSPGAGF